MAKMKRHGAGTLMIRSWAGAALRVLITTLITWICLVLFDDL
jgi:hypothetical protein